MGTLAQDIRYSLRMLARTPVVAAVAVISLALGIGANTAIFSLLNALVLRSLPIRDSSHLVRISTTTAPQDPDQDEGLSLAMLRQIRSTTRDVFSDTFTWGLTLENLEANGVKYAATSSTVSGEYFSSIGAKAYLGRLIGPEDLSLDSGFPAPVAVISYLCWQRHYNGDPQVLGKTIRVRENPLTIIGVTPEHFSGLYVDSDIDVTVPIGFSGKTVYRDRKWLGLDTYAHLKDGVTLEQARAKLESIWPGILGATVPEGFAGTQRDHFLSHRIQVVSFANGSSFLRRRFNRPLNVLMAMVAILLLVACMNLANLMLARAAGRAHEFGIRMALGAARLRLMRQMLIESLMLSLGGAALGFVIAYRATHFIAEIMWTGFGSMALEPSPDMLVLAFTTLISILTGAAFGLSPAWGIFKTDPIGSLRRSSRSVQGGAGYLANLLIIVQVALSIVLVIGAMLFVRSLDKLRSSDVGYRRDGFAMVLLFPQWDPNGPNLPNRASYYRELAERVQHLPGVESASFSGSAPMTLTDDAEPAAVHLSQQAPIPAIPEWIAPGFFHVAGMRLLAGRDFEWRDDESSRPVAIVSESLARRLFPAGDAIGKLIDIGERQGLTIVGIVNSASLWSGRTHEPPAVHMPLMQQPRYNSPNLDVRLTGDAGTVLPSVRRVVDSMGHHASVRAETMEQRVDRSLTIDRMIAMLSSFFGGLALLLASIGLYGLMSYAVERRTSEIGIRVALGSQRVGVLKLILKDVLWMVGSGLVIGIPAAWAASRLISGMVFGVAVNDSLTVVASSGILIAVALLAGYFPARRASMIDPINALRSE